MKKFVIINKLSGEVLQTYHWDDDRDFPSDIVLGVNEELLTTLADDDIDIYHTYNTKTNTFYIIDPTYNESEIADIKEKLSDLDSVLPRVQEDTWAAIGIDETKLPQIWQDRLKQKRDLRAQLSKLTL